jgi:hypothetical protein
VSAPTDVVAQEFSERLDELLRTDFKDLSKDEAKWILPKVCSCPVLFKNGKKVAAFRCKNFRESKCPHCAGIKAGDTNRIIHAGIAKANTELEFDGWIAFITLTLGSNGKVHRCTKFSVSDDIFGEKQPTEVPCGPCNDVVHDPEEGLHATPLDLETYDTEKHVVEGENVGELFRTTMKSFNEKLETATGRSDCLRYCRAVELQERWSPHVHAIVVLSAVDMKAMGGPRGFQKKFKESAEVRATTLPVLALNKQIRKVEKELQLSRSAYGETFDPAPYFAKDLTPPTDDEITALYESRTTELKKRLVALKADLKVIPERLHTVGWGTYNDVRFVQPLTTESTDDEIIKYKETRARLAKYLAKYITKSLASDFGTLTPAQKAFQARIADKARSYLWPQYQNALAKLEAKRESMDPNIYNREVRKAYARFERLALAGACNAQRFTTSRNWSDLNYKKLQEVRARYMAGEIAKAKPVEPARNVEPEPVPDWEHDGAEFQKSAVPKARAVAKESKSDWEQVLGYHKPSNGLEMAALHLTPQLGIDGYGELKDPEKALRCMYASAIATNSHLLPFIEAGLEKYLNKKSARRSGPRQRSTVAS